MTNKLNTLLQYLFLAALFILPIGFLSGVSLPLTKTFIVVVITVIAAVVWVIARFKDGIVRIPKTWITPALVLLPLVAFISALASPNVSVSLWGYAFEVGTAGFIAAVTLLALLVAFVERPKEKIVHMYAAFLGSFVLIGLFILGRLIFREGFLSFGIFKTLTQNPLGSWGEMGIFFGLVVAMTVMTLELFTLTRRPRIFLNVLFVFALLLTIAVNFTLVWYALGVFSIVFFVYLITSPRPFDAPRKISYVSLVTFVVSLLILVGGAGLSQKISNKTGMQDVDVRPSWAVTFDIAGKALKDRPIVGAGPNRFVNEWLAFKPSEVNNTIFWNTDFMYGIGFLPTLLVTQGALGALAWLIFFVLFLWIGFRTILRPIADQFSRYLLVSSFFSAVFLFTFFVIYIPGPVTFALAFMFVGIFISLLGEAGIPWVELPILRDPKIGFVSILVLVALLAVSLSGGYIFLEKYFANWHYQASLAAFNQKNDLDAASRDISEAVTTSASDVFYQSLASVDIARMNNLLQRKDLTQEELRNQFQTYLGSAIVNAKQATALDPTNYLNWAVLGNVYETVLPLGITGAYDNAKGAYNQALSLNPHSPAILLTLARLEAKNSKLNDAKEYIRQAINEKHDYTDAIFLLAQIQVAEGNIKDAIQSVEAAAFIAPNDPGTLFQLGVLRYSTKDFRGAVDALSRAVSLNTSYSNARYFLGLALAELKDYPGAIEQFKAIQQYNPDNEEVKLILSNLQAGRAPLAGAKPPLDTTPEKRTKLPIKEQ